MNENSKQIKPHETELLLHLQEGDENAFSSLFYAYKDKLYGFLLGLTQSAEKAEDIIQDVFLKVWLNRATITEIENFNAYLFRMAQNQYIDQLRKFSKETLALPVLSAREEMVTADGPVDQLINKEIREKINEAVNKLPPQQKKIYILHKEDGFRHEEIARQLNLSVSTIQNHMGQALGNIRRFLSYTYPGLFALFMYFCKNIRVYF
jgi:RNA polymerase sigma-70 factor (family 1)